MWLGIVSLFLPDYKKRENFRWQRNYVFRLEHFKDDYSYVKHQHFIYGAIHAGLSSDKKQLFLKIYHDAERENSIKEREKR